MIPRSLTLLTGQVISLVETGISGGNWIYKEDGICFGHFKVCSGFLKYSGGSSGCQVQENWVSLRFGSDGYIGG